MNADEIKSLLEEVFFEDEYKISNQEYERYRAQRMRFYVDVYSEKLNKHIPMLTIENFIMGTTVIDDVWQMTWTLPTQNYYMTIPGTSFKRNPNDVGDPKTFLMLSKEKLNDILLINRLTKKLMDDMREMDKEPMTIIREFKLKNIL
jgi:hypothetical protein